MNFFAVCLTAAVSLFSHIIYAQGSLLTPGDIAIVGFNFKNPDQFAFVTFVPLEAGTIIHFTDCGWQSSGSFRASEGVVTYKVPVGGRKAGDVVLYSNSDDFTKTGVSGFWGLSQEGDQILVYQGTFSAPNFIFALNSNASHGWDADADSTLTSALPQGLVEGVSAISFPKYINANYNCSVSVGKKLVKEAILNPVNWQASSSPVSLPPVCDFVLPLFIHDFSYQLIEGVPELTVLLSQRNPKVKIQFEKSKASNPSYFYKVGEIVKADELQISVHDLEFDEDTYYRAQILHENGIDEYLEPVFVNYSENPQVRLVQTDGGAFEIRKNFTEAVNLSFYSINGNILRSVIMEENVINISDLFYKEPDGIYCLSYYTSKVQGNYKFYK